MSDQAEPERSSISFGSLVLSDSPQLDDALILRLQYDLATGVHQPEIIAQRYGLRNKETLREYLRQHPQVVLAARRARALIASDQGAETRVRLKALHATEDLIVATHELAGDPRTPMQQRLDAFKQLSRIAGVDSQAQKVAAAPGGGGHSFVLNILFSGGATQHFEGQVIDQIASPSEIPLPVVAFDEEGGDEPEDV